MGVNKILIDDDYRLDNEDIMLIAYEHGQAQRGFEDATG